MKTNISSYSSTPKNPSNFRTYDAPSYPSRRAASTDRFQLKPITVPNLHNLSLSPDLRSKQLEETSTRQYENKVEAPLTLPEAQMKIVLLSCEVDRVSDLNYKLVKENELLRLNVAKTDRERDLETKLAIVLAENEKLIQVVEEIHQFYKEDRAPETSKEIERNIEDLIKEVEQNKQSYQGTQSFSELKEKIAELEAEKTKLHEQINGNLESIQRDARYSGDDLNDIMKRNSVLIVENERLKKDLDLMTIRNGEITSLQMKLKDYEDTINKLIAEKEEMNNLFKHTSPIKDGRDTRLSRNVTEKLEFDTENNIEKVREESLYRTPVREAKKNYGRYEEGPVQGYLSSPYNNPTLRNNIEELIDGNYKLNDLVGNQVKESVSLKDRIKMLLAENSRLEELLKEKSRTIDHMGPNEKKEKEILDQKARIEFLLSENKRLEDLLNEKTKKIESLLLEQGKASYLSHFSFNENQEQKGKIETLTTENKRLENVVKEKDHVIETMKSQHERVTSKNMTKHLPPCPGGDQFNAALHNKETEVMAIRLSLGMIEEELESLEKIKNEINARMKKPENSQRVNSFMDDVRGKHTRAVNAFQSPDTYNTSEIPNYGLTEANYRALGSESASHGLREATHSLVGSGNKNYEEINKKSYQIVGDNYSIDRSGEGAYQPYSYMSSPEREYRTSEGNYQTYPNQTGTQYKESYSLTSSPYKNLEEDKKSQSGYPLQVSSEGNYLTSPYKPEGNNANYSNQEIHTNVSPINYSSSYQTGVNYNASGTDLRSPEINQAVSYQVEATTKTLNPGNVNEFSYISTEGVAKGQAPSIKGETEINNGSSLVNTGAEIHQYVTSKEVPVEIRAEIAKLIQENEKLADIIQKNNTTELEKVRKELDSKPVKAGNILQAIETVIKEAKEAKETKENKDKYSINIKTEDSKPSTLNINLSSIENKEAKAGGKWPEASPRGNSLSIRLGDQTPFTPGGTRKIQAHTTDFEFLKTRKEEFGTPSNQEGRDRWIKALETENKRLNSVVEKKNSEIKELAKTRQENQELTKAIDDLKKDIQEKQATILSFVPITMGEEDTRKELNGLESENKELRKILEKKENEIKRLNLKLLESFTNNINNNQGKDEESPSSKDPVTKRSLISPRYGKDSIFEDNRRHNLAGDNKDRSTNSSVGAYRDPKTHLSALDVQSKKLSELMEGSDSNTENLSDNGLENNENIAAEQEIKTIRKDLAGSDKNSEIVKAAFLEIEEAKKKIAGLMDENTKLNTVLKEKDRVLKTLNTKLVELSDDVNESKVTTKEISKLRADLNQAKQENEEENTGSDNEKDIELQVEVLRSVIEAKGLNKEGLKTLQQEQKEHKQKLADFEEENTKLKEIIEKNEKEIAHLNTLLADEVVKAQSPVHASKEITEIKEEVARLRKENDRLSDELEEKTSQIMIMKKVIATKDKAIESFKVSTQTNEESKKKQVETLEKEIFRLSGVLQTKEEEVSGLKEIEKKLDLVKISEDLSDIQKGVVSRGNDLTRLNSIVDEKEIEIENLKTMLEEKEKIVEESKALESGVEKLEKMVEMLVGENERLKGLLSEKMSEVKKLKEERRNRKRDLSSVSEDSAENLSSRVFASESENVSRGNSPHHRKLLSFVDSVKYEGDDKEAKLVVDTLKGEIVRLVKEIELKNQEIDELAEEVEGHQEVKQDLAKKKEMVEGIEKLMNKFVEQKETIDTQMIALESKREKLEKENISLKEELKNVKEELENETNRFNKVIQNQKKDAEEKVNRLSGEIGRVQAHLNRTLMELQEERKRFSELEVLRAQEIDSIRQQYEAFEKDEAEIPLHLEAERAVYEMQIDQLQNNLMEAERENESLREENKEFQKLSAKRLRENEELRKQLKALEEKYKTEIIEIKKHVGSLQANKQDVDQLANKHKAEKVIDQAQITTLQKMNENYKEEIEKLKNALEDKKKGFWDVSQQYNALKHMYETLKQESHEKAIESEQRLERLNLLEREVVELEHLKDQYKKKAESLKKL